MHVIMIIFMFIPNSLGIYGGMDASIENFPHHVAIEHNGKGVYLCGGAIISDTQVITAAHCVYGLGSDELTVRSGTNTLKSGGSLHNVKKVKVHEEYELSRNKAKQHKSVYDSSHENDIALIRVDTPFKFNEKCRAIGMFDKGEGIPLGDMANVTGWGNTYERFGLSSKLKFADLPILHKTIYNLAYLKKGGSSNGKICAGDYNSVGLTKDSCHGDSGGGLVVNGRLAGIVSSGKKCGLPDYPGVYTEIAYFRDWIREHAGF